MRKNVCFLIVALLVFGSCQKKAPPPGRPPAMVTVAQAIEKNVPYTLKNIGNTRAYNSASLVAQISGNITNVYFNDGDDVKKGELLYSIDSRLYAAQLLQAKGNLEQAKATLAYNKQVVDSYGKLVKDNFVAPLTFEQYLSNVETAAAQVEQFTGAVAQAETNLSYCSIRAPFDGKAGQNLFDVGNFVSPTQTSTPLVVLNQMSPIYVTFTLPEKELPLVQKYNTPEGLQLLVTIPSDNGPPVTGKLSFIDNAVNSLTGTVAFEALIPNEDRRLWPNQFVNVALILYEIPNAVLVPVPAVQINTQGNFLFVVNMTDSTVAIRPVKVGQVIGDQQVILSGLKVGETVVTQGQVSLYPGAKITIKK